MGINLAAIREHQVADISNDPHCRACGHADCDERACDECEERHGTVAVGQWMFCLRCCAIRHCASCDKAAPRHELRKRGAPAAELFCLDCCHEEPRHA
jgi:hypothetical protein